MATKRKNSWQTSAATALAPMFKPQTPAPPTVTPPPGTYDPGFDAQARAGDRGLAQLLQDLGKAGTRADDQHTIDRSQINQGADWSLADLLRGHTREGEDYGRATADLGENYKRLGASQAGAAVQAGVAEGGTFAAALKARQTNQGHDQSGLDLQHTRAGEDYSTQTGRVTTARDQQLGDVDRQYGYGVVDRADTGQRAQSENTFYGQDINDQKLSQAGQNGWLAPPSYVPPSPTLTNYFNTTAYKPKRKPGASIQDTTAYVPAMYR